VAKGFSSAVLADLKKAAAKQGQAIPDATLRAVGEAILADAEARVMRRGLEAELLPVAKGDPAEAILVAIRQTGASTVVMGSRGTSDADASGMGSVSQKVFHKAECTCISVK